MFEGGGAPVRVGFWCKVSVGGGWGGEGAATACRVTTAVVGVVGVAISVMTIYRVLFYSYY